MNLLSIAGSDPSSGAGIQSDVRTFTTLGNFPFTVITAITSQNTRKFGKVESVSSKMIKNQIDAIFSDFKIDAIKIGMVYDSPTIKILSKKLSRLNIPIILDPVLKSTTGGVLLKKDALNDYKKFLLPIGFIITPNLLEASILSGIKIKNSQDLKKSVLKIKKFGAKNIVVTGIDFEKNVISDCVFNGKKMNMISGKLYKQINHGSGCNFSAALTVAIAKGKNVFEAAKFAKKFTYESIKNSKKIGKGITITNSVKKPDKNIQLLEEAINDFTNIKKIYSLIPECQTNFVFSKNKIKSIKDILGVSGRIVKAGKEVIVAGTLRYGGSKHVGSALLEINKKFPQIKSAVNIKYDSKLIKLCKKKSFIVQSYDRKKEPTRIKRKENSSISWGIKNSLKNSSIPPDVIYHKGDFGKEPMIMVFGNDPSKVVEKIAKIL